MDLTPLHSDADLAGAQHAAPTAQNAVDTLELDPRAEASRIVKTLVIGSAPLPDKHLRLDVTHSAGQALAMRQQAWDDDEPYGLAVIQADVDAAVALAEADPELEILLHGIQPAEVTEAFGRLPAARSLVLGYLPSPRELTCLTSSVAARRAERLQLQTTVESRAKALLEANRRLKQDMEVRMQMLQELLESEERYRRLFEEDITGDFVAGPDGKLKACNQAFARIFGFADVDAAMGVNIFDLRLETSDKECLRELLASSERAEDLEAVFQPEGHRPVYVIGNVMASRGPNGKLGEIRGYLLDITERKRLEEQLRVAQKIEAIGTLAGGIAHDFNNILGVITGYAEIVLENTEKGTPTHRRVREILGACRRAKDLINQVLNFSRQGKLEKKALRVTPLIRETIKLLRSSLPARVSVRESILPGNDTVMADPSQVQQILLNLYTNAAQAMAESGGELEVGLNEVHLDDDTAAQVQGLSAGAYVVLSVSDQGPGISEAIQERIFDPFFTTKKPGEGTGMGLAVVHGIVKRHGGVVLVHSELGKGTAFQVFLPMAEMLAEDEHEEDILPAGSGRVLYVDDEKALVDIGCEMLKSLGYEVVARTSSVEALEAFRHQPDRFDYIIADQNMPNMSGLELATKAMDVRPDIPVILCTGFSEVVSYGHAQDIGVKDIIMKPMLKRQLAEALHRVQK